MSERIVSTCSRQQHCRYCVAKGRILHLRFTLFLQYHYYCNCIAHHISIDEDGDEGYVNTRTGLMGPARPARMGRIRERRDVLARGGCRYSFSVAKNASK